MVRHIWIAALPALLFAGAAQAQHAPPAGPTPGAHSGEPGEVLLRSATGVRAFYPAPGGQGIYLQDARKDWYYASFFPNCFGSDFAMNIGFRPFAGGNRLLRGDTVFANGKACEIADLVHSGPPTGRPRRTFPPHRSAANYGWGWRTHR